MRTLLHILIILASLTACASNRKTTNTDTVILYGEEARAYKAQHDMGAQAGKTISHQYDVSPFTALSNEISVDVYYQQGSAHSVKATGRADLIAQLDVSVEEGVLRLRNKKRIGSWRGKIRVDITAPRIDRWSNSGSFALHIDDISAEEFRLSNSGVFSLMSGTVSTTQTSISNSGLLLIQARLTSRQDFTLRNSGQMNCKGNMQGEGAYSLSNSGSMQMEGKMEGRTAEIKNSGVLHVQHTIRAHDFSMSNSGSAIGSILFKGGAATFRNSGQGNLNVDCDCTDLNATTSGSFTMTIKGTADNTSIKSSGVSHIDAKGLNNF